MQTDLSCLLVPDGFWDRVFPTALGALIGGLVTLGSIIIKEWFDRRRAIQSWYEQTYITEGVDRLVVYVSSLDDIVFKRQFEDTAPERLFQEYPREAAERFQLLFPGHSMVWLRILREECEKSRTGTVNQDGIRKGAKAIRAMHEALTGLHKSMLEARIKKKVDVYSIREDPNISSIHASLEAKLLACFDRKLLPDGSVQRIEPSGE